MPTPPRPSIFRFGTLTQAVLLLAASTSALPAEENGWIPLTNGTNLEAWKSPSDQWIFTDGVEIDPQKPRALKAGPGKGDTLVNGPGRLRDLASKQSFGDVEAHLEFLIPKGSNSGIKFNGQYEIQILDSHGTTKKLTGDACGGVYPRAEPRPRYHHIDEGVAPRTNAAKPAGEWQTLDIVFRAPRFDADGKKTANARFVKVVLNGQVVHEDVEVKTPTGAAWHDPERPRGPVLLQADHGPVAFRNVRVRPLAPEMP